MRTSVDAKDEPVRQWFTHQHQDDLWQEYDFLTSDRLCDSQDNHVTVRSNGIFREPTKVST